MFNDKGGREIPVELPYQYKMLAEIARSHAF
jgi:hypothetical protein